jgi:hypothetical protein
MSSVVVERASPRCVHAVQCTAWMSFACFSCCQGATCRSSVARRPPPCFTETRRLSASVMILMMAPSMTMISSKRSWRLSSTWLLHKLTKKCTGGFLPAEKHTTEVYGVARIVMNFQGFFEMNLKLKIFWVFAGTSGL